MKTLTSFCLLMSLTAFAEQGSESATEDGFLESDSPKVNLEKGNTSPNPIPEDTTLQGETYTGPYKNSGVKQSQESSEKELDYRAISPDNE